MGQFDLVFNPAIQMETIFFSVKTVAEYPSLLKFEKENPIKFNLWVNSQKDKCDDIYNNDSYYHAFAPYLPEYAKIVAISYGAYNQDKPIVKILSNHDEIVILKLFRTVLNEANKRGFNIICGHNITTFDIPLLLKKYVTYRDEFGDDESKIPTLLKRSITSKPWENNVIDTSMVWKFGGIGFSSINEIKEVLNIQTGNNEMLNKLGQISQDYWAFFNSQLPINDDDKKQYLQTLSNQAVNQVKIVIDFVNMLRYC